MDRVLVLAVAVLVVMAGGARASTTARLVDATVARPALVGGGVLVVENNTIPILARAGSYYAVAPTSSNQVISKDSYDCMRTSYGVRYALVNIYDNDQGCNPDGFKNYHNAIAGGLEPIGLIVPCAECNWKHERNGTGQAVEAMECLAAAGHDPSGAATFLQIGLQDQTWQTDCLLNGVFLTDFTERLGDFGVAYGVYTSVDDYVAIICPTLGSYAWNLWYEAYDGVPDTATWKAFGSFVQPFAKAYAANATACGATFDLSISSYPYW